MLIKKYHNAFIPDNIFSSVIPKDVFVQENIQGNIESNKLECNKKSKDVMIDYFNRHLSKLALKTLIHKDIFVFKDTYRISYFDQIWAQKDSKELLPILQFLIALILKRCSVAKSFLTGRL